MILCFSPMLFVCPGQGGSLHSSEPRAAEEGAAPAEAEHVSFLWMWQEMWWVRLFLCLGLWSVTGCKREGGVRSLWINCCANLLCLLSFRSLLEQLHKLQALVKQSTTKMTTLSTCVMVSGFSSSVWEGALAVPISLGDRCLLQPVMPFHILLL